MAAAQAAALAPDLEQNVLVLDVLGQLDRIVRSVDGLAVDLLDDIADAQARFVGGGVLVDIRDHRAFKAAGNTEAAAGGGIEIADGHAVEGVAVVIVAVIGLGDFFTGQFLDRDVQGFLPAVAQNLDGDMRSGRGFGDLQFQMTAVGDRLVVEFLDHVAALEAGSFGRAVGRDVTDEGALVTGEIELLRERRRHVLDHHAEVTAHDAATGDEAGHDRAGEIDGDGETDALITAAAAEDGGVDADQTAFRIHERAAGVAGVDGGVGLDEVFVIGAEPAAAGG